MIRDANYIPFYYLVISLFKNPSLLFLCLHYAHVECVCYYCFDPLNTLFLYPNHIIRYSKFIDQIHPVDTYAVIPLNIELKWPNDNVHLAISITREMCMNI